MTRPWRCLNGNFRLCAQRGMKDVRRAASPLYIVWASVSLDNMLGSTSTACLPTACALAVNFRPRPAARGRGRHAARRVSSLAAFQP